jgi:RNA-splicing ligase RtcB
MPDVHWGIGATVGSVIPTRGAIIPAAVGVDIGCGMTAVETSLNVARSARQPARNPRGDREGCPRRTY